MSKQSATNIVSMLRMLLVLCAVGSALSACGSSSNSTSPPPPPPPADITIGGVVSDGAVTGGSLFVFAADQVQTALDSIDPDGPDGSRLEALAAADSITMLTRDTADEDQYTLDIPGDFEGEALFFIFDNTDAEDEMFGDDLPNLESVVIAGDAGDTQRVNLSLQTTFIAQIVRAALDPDGDGTAIDAAAIRTEIDTATASVLAAFGEDALGRNLYPPGYDPIDDEDDDLVHRLSAVPAQQIRMAASLLDVEYDEVIAALAADAADGAIDGAIPMSMEPEPELEMLALDVAAVATIGGDDDIAVFAAGPCSSAAVSMRQACAVDIMDDLFGSIGICADMIDDVDRAECLAEAATDRVEGEEECDDVFDARLELCDDLGDLAHEPMFGPAFAASFVDPLQIGTSVAVNPWFPLQTGNQWVYESDDETVEVVVTDETKLIDGITCVEVVDTASEGGVVVEITRDWYAQGVNGDVWYCGEIARNFETFEGDAPEDPELVDIDGSWKAGRDGAEPGILLPFSPAEGAIIRQEVLFGEAEDVIEIISLTGSEAAPAASCVATCLVTNDTTPLDSEADESKFYAPGIGLIVEIDNLTGDRVELAEFTPGP